MSKIQIGSSRSSSATHHMTQPSTTLNRRYVKRPSNIVIEAAAREAARAQVQATKAMPPSRLVNLRVSSADLEAARKKEAEIKQISASATTPKTEIIPDSVKTEPQSITIMPRVIELGSVTPDQSDFTPTTSSVPVDKSSEMPVEAPEATVEEPNTTPINPQITEPNPQPTTQNPMPAALPQITHYDPWNNQYHQASAISEAVLENQNHQPADVLPETNTTPAEPEIDTATLAMNIAADYAAASLEASVKEYGNGYNNYAIEQDRNTYSAPTATEDSVDAIARAASEAIASIRTASAPNEVSEQITSLQAFADSIKSQYSTPEMRELGDTIDKFVNVAMKSTKMQETSKKSDTKVTLSPKANRAAAKVTKSSAKVMAVNSRAKQNNSKAITKPRPLPRTTTPHQSAPKAAVSSMRKRSPQELKDRAIEQAMRSMATMESTPNKKRQASFKPVAHTKRKTSFKRFIIATGCALACIAGVVYFVSSNIPDVSIRVAAMQTGIQASYPSYVPREYTLNNIDSEAGKINMHFDGPNNSSFNLVEEKSSWDSSALLRNYVEPTWGDNYTTTHEQGITIYISNVNCDAVWVNGGVLYTITSSGTSLTKKQVRNIVVSL